MTSLLPFRPLVVTTLAVALLSACTSSVRVPAPVEDRSGMVRAPQTTSAPVTTTSAEVAKPLPGSENAGKPGYHTVQRGDTLTRIGLDNGQGWRDLARWNNLTNPNVIEVGQVLRVTPPGASVETSGVVVRPISPSGNASATAAPPKPEPAAAPPNNALNDEGLGFIWPANGVLIAGFDEAKNKGLDIGGKAGDPVMAAADGQVVYAGSGLRGYGNLIILKHNNTFLTAYAHNQALLVKEDQKVRKGQKIAEMGKSDTDRVKLHFEVRRQGKPVDPAKLLPAR
ncbi:peptidoglycan DD-metalloendopeptidase family protein [Limnohabitans sp. 2KL-27]|uniref:peptidoglycan DD-metalloendopeptidase family protein n=1 Tax=Limnohabitans sp. 2KL-27 TaxID=1100705 RepID=UPI000A730B25|nr:peptidoglycan DD-metalloendopeptidase family protein [Limnohabitans sp. 2KL-27]